MSDSEANNPSEAEAEGAPDVSEINSELSGDFSLEKEDEQPKDTIKRLRDKLKECTAKKQEYLSGWQRAKADLVNAKKEFDDERDQIKRRGKEAVISDILPALDSFAMAMSNTTAWESVDEEWRKGVEQIHNQLLSALEKNGVKTIEPKEGDDFNPQLHSSVDTKSSGNDHEDNTIARCEQTGYQLDDRIIRSAQVVVYQKNSDNTTNE